MAFGLSAGAMGLIGAVAPSVVGGLMGGQKGSGGGSQSSMQNTIDPRMEKYIYGDGGVMPGAQDWYAKNKTGLNGQMLQGLNNQAAQLAASGPGYNQMQNLGLSMMGGGVAGNPFAGGYQGGTNFGGGGQGAGGGGQGLPGMAYKPATFDATPQAFGAPTAQAASAPTAPTSDMQNMLDEWLGNQQKIKMQQDVYDTSGRYTDGLRG